MRGKWILAVIMALLVGGLVITSLHLGAQQTGAPGAEGGCFRGIAYDVHDNPKTGGRVWAVTETELVAYGYIGPDGSYFVWVPSTTTPYWLNYDGTPGQGTGPVYAGEWPNCAEVDIHPNMW